MQTAAIAGDTNSQFRLGIAYQTGTGISKSPTSAVYWFRKAAQQGDLRALRSLGQCYYLGNGVETDYKAAVRCYSQAAIKGNTAAQVDLGICYFAGKGVDKNPEEGLKWIECAAEAGYIAGIIELAKIYIWGCESIDKNPKLALNILKNSEAADARYFLAIIYLFGLGGVNPDENCAWRYMEDAARRGYIAAQVYLAERYISTETKRGVRKAKSWYLRAAKQGDKDSAFNVAIICFNNRKYNKGLYWLKRVVLTEPDLDSIALMAAYWMMRKNYQEVKATLSHGVQGGISENEILQKAEEYCNEFKLR